MNTPKKRRLMRKLWSVIRTCRQCPGLNRWEDTEATIGFGDLDSPVMFVGQSLHTIHPNFLYQIPFVNPRGMPNSGNLIFEAVGEAGLNWWDVFTSNIVHCHPFKNRVSLPLEKKNCKPFLLSEIGIVKPRLIVCLGADATKSLLGNNMILPKPILRTIKTPHGDISTKVIGFKHPASFLYSPSAEGTLYWKKKLVHLLRAYS